MDFGTVGEIRYTYPKTRYMDKFYNIKSIIADFIVNSGEHDVVQKHATIVENNWIGSREINDYSTKSTAGLSKVGADILRKAKVTQRTSAVYMQTLIRDVFGDNVIYSIYTTFGRGSSSEVIGVGMSGNTTIAIRELFNSYGNEKFSAAIRVSQPNDGYTTMRYGIALASVGSPDGIRGNNVIQVIEYTESSINIDNADKYMSCRDIKVLTDGLSL